VAGHNLPRFWGCTKHLPNLPAPRSLTSDFPFEVGAVGLAATVTHVVVGPPRSDLTSRAATLVRLCGRSWSVQLFRIYLFDLQALTRRSTSPAAKPATFRASRLFPTWMTQPAGLSLIWGSRQLGGSPRGLRETGAVGRRMQRRRRRWMPGSSGTALILQNSRQIVRISEISRCLTKALLCT
jgi:hypothetical protein